MFWNGDGISLSYLIGGNFGYVKKRNKCAMSTSQKVFFKNIFGNPVCCAFTSVGDHACVGSFAKVNSRAKRVPRLAKQASTNEKAFFYGCEAVKVVMLDRCGL